LQTADLYQPPLKQENHALPPPATLPHPGTPQISTAASDAAALYAACHMKASPAVKAVFPSERRGSFFRFAHAVFGLLLYFGRVQLLPNLAFISPATFVIPSV
jgi:hypothetical protein